MLGTQWLAGAWLVRVWAGAWKGSFFLKLIRYYFFMFWEKKKNNPRHSLLQMTPGATPPMA